MTIPPYHMPRIGHGYDVHAFENGDYITLCGIKIPHTHAFKAHSDGDVALHALTDALYGSIADGDIGTHFPPSDDQWKNMDSAVFLHHAISKIQEKNAIICNIDITIICESPKIQPLRQKMRQRISELFSPLHPLSIDNISIKATTSEKLGFTGRKEGIATHASVMILQPSK